jgi:hypothetical protein
MGDHYIPKYYLKGFTQNESESIYAFDKAEKKCFLTQPKSVANETDYYSQQVEAYLSEKIEFPANDVIRKIRDQNPITPDDKLKLAIYMLCMIKRVPEGKNFFNNLAPSAAKSVREHLSKEINLNSNLASERMDWLKKRTEEINEMLNTFVNDPPKEFWLKNLFSETNQIAIEVLNMMTWCFLTFKERPVFLTSGNPVFFFKSLGIGKPLSEVSFPISSNIVLWASWRKDLKEDYFPMHSQTVKEINRRTCRSATRFVFCSTKEDWILPMMEKGKLQLNRIQFG